jgi:hypothetical protein
LAKPCRLKPSLIFSSCSFRTSLIWLAWKQGMRRVMTVEVTSRDGSGNRSGGDSRCSGNRNGRGGYLGVSEFNECIML